MRFFYNWKRSNKNLQNNQQIFSNNIDRNNLFYYNNQVYNEHRKSCPNRLQKIKRSRKYKWSKSVVRDIPENVFFNDAVLQDLRIYSPEK